MFNVFIYSNNLSMLSKVYNAIKLKTQYNVAGFLNSYEHAIDAINSINNINIKIHNRLSIILSDFFF